MRISAFAVLPALTLVVCADEPIDTAQAAPPPAPTSFTLSADYLEPLLPMSEELTEALIKRKHDTAAGLLSEMERSQLPGTVGADQAFLLAWELLRTDRASEATSLINIVDKAEHVPESYRALVLGELLLEGGEPVEAALKLAEVPDDTPISTRARLKQAEAHQAAGATREALIIYQALAARPDPIDGNAEALLAVANRVGQGSPDAYPYLRRLWAHYPRTGPGRTATRRLDSYESQGRQYKPSRLEIAQHGESLMRDYRFDNAVDFLRPHMGKYTEGDAASCIAWYTYGRSRFKRNHVTDAAAVLTPAGKKCAGIDQDRGAKSLYIAGKALERKKQWGDAGTVYQRIPELYPEHTMADDGYALAGIGYQESGNMDKAMALWAAQVEAYPQGDLAAEGFWRLAWNSYRAGDPETAIQWAESMIWTVPLESDPVHVMAGHYWSARWKLYPDVNNPDQLSLDAESVAEGINDLTALCREHTTRFYSLLAAARLYELAPERLDEITRPVFTGAPDTWQVNAPLAESVAMERALQLARLGLVTEALDELSTLDRATLGPTGMSIYSEIQAKKDWVGAHDRLHKYLLAHPPSTISDNQDHILRTAYPQNYWDLTQQAADGYGFDPRIFFSLVREESSFNKDIVSWAGARGLSQLMPATARQVGGWLGMSVTKETSFDPLSNLKIGTRYMEYLQERFEGNMFLAVAGYNAGEGNVEKWLRQRGNKPTDEYIEDIPYRETRGYVKRVLGTYQVYRTVYDPGTPFPDWSAYNHKAKL